MQEVLIPLKQWGRKYVAAAAPVRGNPGVDPPSMGENHYWRVYAASPDTSITATPDVSNSCPDENGNVSFPISLETRGDYVEFCVAAGTNFVLESDKPFMPVEYIQSQWSFPEPLEYSAGNGDPSMVQMVPVDQYLGRYTFITGVGFAFHYLQVIRAVGNAHVMLDGTAIDASNFVSVGDFEVATVEITEGAHEVVSDDTFGIIQVGYASSEVDENSEPVDGCINPGSDFRCNSSYAYPGGMGTEEIFVP
jgi:hypothetical protein